MIARRIPARDAGAQPSALPQVPDKTSLQQKSKKNPAIWRGDARRAVSSRCFFGVIFARPFLVLFVLALNDVRDHQRDDDDKGHAQQPKNDRHEGLHC
jgi:hypothetical protein